MIQRADDRALYQRRHMTTATELALRLSLEADRSVIRAGESIRFAATILNFGTEPLILVEPGDGSEAGWRTPIVGWSILHGSAADLASHPDEPDLKPARGENVDPLGSDEIFVLQPGEQRRLSEWIEAPRLTRLGTHRVVMYYRNDPWATIEGLPFEPHDPAALDLIRSTTPCTLVSNEVVVEVVE